MELDLTIWSNLTGISAIVWYNQIYFNAISVFTKSMNWILDKCIKWEFIDFDLTRVHGCYMKICPCSLFVTQIIIFKSFAIHNWILCFILDHRSQSSVLIGLHLPKQRHRHKRRKHQRITGDKTVQQANKDGRPKLSLCIIIFII